MWMAHVLDIGPTAAICVVVGFWCLLWACLAAVCTRRQVNAQAPLPPPNTYRQTVPRVLLRSPPPLQFYPPHPSAPAPPATPEPFTSTPPLHHHSQQPFEAMQMSVAPTPTPSAPPPPAPPSYTEVAAGMREISMTNNPPL